MNESTLDRRRFGASLAACAAGASLVSTSRAVAQSGTATSVSTTATTPQKTFLKAVKWGMIEGDASPLEKFQLCKELGYDGMELISPTDIPAEELRSASAETGMPIHGLVDMKHWQVRLSSPDEATRNEGRVILEQAIRDAHAQGGHTVLLVPGKAGDDGTHDDVWQRSIPQIRKVLPLAASLGIRVLIENVWNGFCETPELLRDYLDEINSPWVGAYYDVGNSLKFAPPEHWIRTLGSRIVKLDLKGWGFESGFGKIGDGDVSWAGVREALAEIGYSGWCTAEVPGGGRERLAEISKRMDHVLGL